MGAIKAGPAGLEMDVPTAVGLARDLGADADMAITLLREFSAGMLAGLAKKGGKG